jgi:hypothetical protein
MLKKVCCGIEYGSEQAFCGSCGKQLVTKNICDKCSVEVKNEAKFCGNCGEPVRIEQSGKIHTAQPTSSYVQTTTTNRNNKAVGMIAVGAVAVILFIAVVLPIFNKPIVGKWNMELYGDNYTAAAFIEFKSNGKFLINTLGMLEEGKYKIIKNGNEGRVSLIPADIKQSSYEVDYFIEGDILNFQYTRFKRAR